MTRSPVLETAAVRVEPFDPARHLTKEYVGWLNEPANVRFSQQRFRRHTLESCRTYVASFEGSLNHFWAIVRKDFAHDVTGKHVGTMTAYRTPADGLADIGILMGDKAAAGRGIATTAWCLVVDYLFRTENVRKITAGTLAVNLPMIRLMERVSMVDDGRRRDHVLWEGRPVDVVYAALFREEWLARRSSPP